MKRYRLVEATSLSGYGMLREEAAVSAVKKALAPIENRTFKLDWDKIEDRLGGPVPYDVRERVERVCGGTTFKGAALIKSIGLAGFAMSTFFFLISFWKIESPMDPLEMGSFLIGVVNILAYLLLRSILKRNISKTGIEDCIRSAKDGELKSDLAWQAIHYSIEGKKENVTRDVCSRCLLLTLATYIGLDVSE